MAGIIYRPDIPHPHFSLVLAYHSILLPHITRELVTKRVREVGDRVPTLDIAIEEDTVQGRRTVVDRLMVCPMLGHWHRLRFGDITRRERNTLRERMQSFRHTELHVR